MFKIDFFVDDKRLPEVLRAVNGKVYNLTTSVVANAKIVKGGKMKEQASGNLRQQLLAKLPEKFTSAQASAAFEELGGQKNSIYNALAAFVKAKAVKKNGDGTYAKIASKSAKK